MVRLPSSRGIGFLVRRRRSDEHAHVLDAAVAGLVEGEPGILVELLPPGGRSVLPVDLRFVGISPAAVPYRGAGIAFGGLCIAGAGGVAAYGIALGRAHSPNAAWHQPHVFSSVLRYREHLRRPGLYVLLGRVRVVRALSPGGAPAWLGPSGAGVWPVRSCAGCQGDLGIAARGRGVVRVGMAPAGELEARGIVALDTAGRPICGHWRISRYCLYRWQEIWPGFVVAGGPIPAALFGGRLHSVAGALSRSAYIQASDNFLLADSQDTGCDAGAGRHYPAALPVVGDRIHSRGRVAAGVYSRSDRFRLFGALGWLGCVCQRVIRLARRIPPRQAAVLVRGAHCRVGALAANLDPDAR